MRFYTTAILFFALITTVTFVTETPAFPGQVDETYGTTGYYFDDTWVRVGNIDQSWFKNAAVLADGSVIAVGARIDNDGMADRRTMYVQKTLPSGFRDPSFGGGTGTFRLLNFASTTDTVANAVRIQPDGKIVVAGVCNIVANPFTQQSRQSGYGMCAIRLLPSGDLDPSFGGNTVQVQHTPSDPTTYFNYTMPAGTTFVHYPGQVETGYAGIGVTVNAAAMDMALNSDGRITLVGYSVTRDFNGNQFLGYNRLASIATLNANGSLSSAVSLPGDQTFEFARRAGRAFRAVVAKSDGGVIAVGYNPIINPTTGFQEGARWVVYDSSTANTYYSENGVNSSRALGIVLTRSNKILVSGEFTPSGGSFTGTLLRRFNNDLTVDPTFGTNGSRFYWHTVADPTNRVSIGGALKVTEVQPDGKILGIVGSISESPLDQIGGEKIVRFNPNGSVDRSIGDSYGGSPTDIFSYGYQMLYRYVNGNVVQRVTAAFAHTEWDGKILAGGAYAPSDAIRAGTTRRQSGFRKQFSPDFDNDGRADISVFRPSNGAWYRIDSFSNAFAAIQWGVSTDKLAPADYDGDGKTDFAVFRNGVWYIYQSSDGQLRVVQWGTAGDLPRPGDFNGDGFADIAVFRPSTGTWYILYSNPIQPGNILYSFVPWGQAGDVPMMGDFDGDGKADVAVYRPSQGYWYILRSSDGQVQASSFGTAEDIPLNGDFNGDSKSDLAVFRPSSATWFIARPTGVPSQNYDAVRFGISTDTTVPADYDKDGKTDVAVYRSGVWWILQSSTGGVVATSFGLNSDIPIPAAYQQ